MRRLFKRMRNTFTAQLVTFVAGLLTSVLMRAVFGQVIPLSEGLLLFLTAILVVFAVTVIANLRQDMNKCLARTRLSADIYHSSESLGSEVAMYDALEGTVCSAKRSVQVVGLAKPPELEVTPHRKRYHEALYRLLETKHRKNERFRFERILQVKEMKEGKLCRNQIDELTYEHCKHLMQLRQSGSSVKTLLRQIPAGVSPISFLIVDNEYVIFLISPITQQESYRLRSYIGTQIVFTDRGGALVERIADLFDDLRLQAHDIVVV